MTAQYRSTASPIAASVATSSVRPTPPEALSQGASTELGTPMWTTVRRSLIDSRARCGARASPCRLWGASRRSRSLSGGAPGAFIAHPTAG